jgi:hypothetical protein
MPVQSSYINSQQHVEKLENKGGELASARDKSRSKILSQDVILAGEASIKPYTARWTNPPSTENQLSAVRAVR